MRKIFIADAHLKNTADENYQHLLRFLAELEGNTDTLFILGDLFEFWIGYRTVPFTQYLPVLEMFQRLRKTGTKIVYFEGNHDFHMGPFFEETLAAQVLPGPSIINLDGKRVYLCHGDQINGQDYGYRVLRLLFHSRLTKVLTLVVPPWIPCAIADWLGSRSKQHHEVRRSRWNYPTMIREFASRCFADGCDVVVTGHFHVPFLDRSGDNADRVLLSLGDWISQYSYGEWRDGNLTLHTFKPDQDVVPNPPFQTAADIS